MKLNSAVELTPMSYEGFARIHPYAPHRDLAGYESLVGDLETWLADITGYDAVSLQPNAGSQGEFAGLLAIRGYHLREATGHVTCVSSPHQRMDERGVSGDGRVQGRRR